MVSRRARAVLWTLLLIGGAGVAHAEQAQLSDLGAATLYELARLTVVYPAGTEREEINRRSALHRASWLHDRHGIETRVLADDRVGPEDLRGNLLLLGWDNRLLGTERAPRPFQRSGDRLDFAGISIREPRADLLLFDRSPYDPNGFLMFWSRIDPELDRYMVLPALGSDWGIYVDFLPVWQGMFGKGGWPPERNPNAEKDHRPELAALRAADVIRESPHYTLHYEPDALTDDEAARVLDARERALARAAELFGVEIGDLRIELHVYASAESKERRTGVPDKVHSLPRRGELHMLAPFALSASPHEEIHHLARRELGPAYLTTMYEGLALEFEASERGENLDLQAALMLEGGRVPGLEVLLDEGRMAALPGRLSFPSAALLVRWLHETFGQDAIAKVYGIRGGIDALGETLDREPGKLARRFERWLRSRAEGQADEVAFLNVMAEAREQWLLADYPAVAEILGRALRLKPADPAALLQLAATEMRLDALGSARERLEALLALPGGQSSPYEARARYELGRVLDLQGERERAVEQYRRVLELPDPSDLHLKARDAIETPVTRESLF